jgi:hypothetical protein
MHPSVLTKAIMIAHTTVTNEQVYRTDIWLHKSGPYIVTFMYTYISGAKEGGRVGR